MVVNLKTRVGRTEQISPNYLALRRMLWRHFSAEKPWVLEWIRIPSDTCGWVNSIWIRYVWTGKFLNPERKSCGVKNIRIRVDSASVTSPFMLLQCIDGEVWQARIATKRAHRDLNYVWKAIHINLPSLHVPDRENRERCGNCRSRNQNFVLIHNECLQNVDRLCRGRVQHDVWKCSSPGSQALAKIHVWMERTKP